MGPLCGVKGEYPIVCIEQSEGHFVYRKLIVKRHDTYSRHSQLTLEWLEGIATRVISSTMNEGSKEHLTPIDSLL